MFWYKVTYRKKEDFVQVKVNVNTPKEECILEIKERIPQRVDKNLQKVV